MIKVKSLRDMTNLPYDAVVFIGRFQPVHDEHLNIISRAFTTLSRKVIIIIGSAGKPRSYKNPFFENERENLIITSLLHDYGHHTTQTENFHIFHSIDYIYNNKKWADEIKKQVKTVTAETDKIAIIGHRKDQSSFYLDIFPEYDLIEQPMTQNLSSTDIRKLYFKESPNLNFLSGVITDSVSEFLKEFSETEDFQMLVREREYEENYKKPFSLLPYPPVFVTADAVVFSGNQILLIERANEPGRGLLALPGGFLDANSDASLQDAMFRELKEETGLELTEEYIIAINVFDAIDRSSRGRVITMAYTLIVPDMPNVIASTDAKTVDWYALSGLNRRQFFEDHFEIISQCGGF
jgi:bifunctional NMN adenylyltransferase/nudix hydrolase